MSFLYFNTMQRLFVVVGGSYNVFMSVPLLHFGPHLLVKECAQILVNCLEN